MNKIITVLSGLCLAAVSYSSPVESQLPHRHLSFNEARTTYALVDGNGEAVKVTMAAKPNTNGEFDVTISVPGGTGQRTYSLLTLGIQSFGQRTTILSAPAAAKFAKLTDRSPTRTVTGGGLVIPPTNPGGGNAINEKNVWFVSFSPPELKLTIRRETGHTRTTVWNTGGGGVAEGHGTEPP